MLDGLTQGSQSVALGLTLAAAPQLVEGLRLMSISRKPKRGLNRGRPPISNILTVIFPNMLTAVLRILCLPYHDEGS